MNALALFSVKTLNGQSMKTCQLDHLRLSHRNARLLRLCHGGMLYQGRINWFVVEELNDPLLTANIDQSLGFGTPIGLPPPSTIFASRMPKGSATSMLQATSLKCCASDKTGKGLAAQGKY